MAYQTFIVHIIAILGIFVGLIATHITELQITNPWYLYVLIPGLIPAMIYAGNQLKPIGGAVSNTTKQTIETTTTPPPTPPAG